MNITYALVSPVRNEEADIEKTIRSVLAQTVLPIKWVIANDGSTDRTEEIIAQYADKYPWMTLTQVSQEGDRNFARKVHCFRAGYAELSGIEYDVIGNLDGDVSFEEDYMEFLLEKFAAMPQLGVAGTPYIENDRHSFRDSYVDINHVHGQIQLFRRSCFEEIGGYTPVTAGGIDWIAVTTARMKGWETRSFQEKTFIHHRAMGTAGRSFMKTQLAAGRKKYLMGGHPVWELFRSVFQMMRKPYIIQGFLVFVGYSVPFIKREKIPISRELVTFHRQEQMDRLRGLMRRGMFRGR